PRRPPSRSAPSPNPSPSPSRRRRTRTSPSRPSWPTSSAAKAGSSLHPAALRHAGRRPPEDRATMLLIGLTGGIGAGKSTVARMLELRGAVVIDADDLARRAVEPGSHGYAEVLR